MMPLAFPPLLRFIRHQRVSDQFRDDFMERRVQDDVGVPDLALLLVVTSSEIRYNAGKHPIGDCGGISGEEKPMRARPMFGVFPSHGQAWDVLCPGQQDRGLRSSRSLSGKFAYFCPAPVVRRRSYKYGIATWLLLQVRKAASCAASARL
jgi:hypothetical protein